MPYMIILCLQNIHRHGFMDLSILMFIIYSSSSVLILLMMIDLYSLKN